MSAVLDSIIISPHLVIPMKFENLNFTKFNADITKFNFIVLRIIEKSKGFKKRFKESTIKDQSRLCSFNSLAAALVEKPC